MKLYPHVRSLALMLVGCLVLISILLSQSGRILSDAVSITQNSYHHIFQVPSETPFVDPYTTDALNTLPLVAPVKPVEAAAYDFRTASLYKAPDNVLEFQLPVGWTIEPPMESKDFISYGFNVGGNPHINSAQMGFIVQNAKTFYSDLDRTGKVNSLQGAIQAQIVTANDSQAMAGLPPDISTPIEDVKVGRYTGKGTMLTVLPSSQSPEEHFYLYLVQVDANTLLYVVASAEDRVVTLAAPLFDQIFSSVVVNVQNVPLESTTFASALTPSATPDLRFPNPTAKNPETNIAQLFLTQVPTQTLQPGIYPFSPVPPGGTPLQITGSYIHPSGLFSIDHIRGWDYSSPFDEETTDQYPAMDMATPAMQGDMQGNGAFQRVSVVFVNDFSYGIAQIYIERNSYTGSYLSVADLNRAFDHNYFNIAWINYTGGWVETRRSTANGQDVIDFTLELNGQTYLGRQIGILDHGWIKGMRLVVPASNLTLLDSFQTALWPTFQFYYQDATAVPLTWRGLVDVQHGIIVRVPSNATLDNPSSATWISNGQQYGLTVQAANGSLIQSTANANTWLIINHSGANLQSIQSDRIAALDGLDAYDVSYTYSDTTAPSGTSSAVTILFNRAGLLYAITFTAYDSNVDLLTPPNTPPVYLQIHDTLLLVPPDARAIFRQLLPSLSPTSATN